MPTDTEEQIELARKPRDVTLFKTGGAASKSSNGAAKFDVTAQLGIDHPAAAKGSLIKDLPGDVLADAIVRTKATAEKAAKPEHKKWWGDNLAALEAEQLRRMAAGGVQAPAEDGPPAEPGAEG